MKIALTCIAKDEDNYIQEWILYHQKLGFDAIYVYQNNWRLNHNYNNVFKIEFDGWKQQVPAYNHFLQTYNHLYDWCAFFDVDEFLVLKKHNDIKDFILDYYEAPAIGINWVYMGDIIDRKINTYSYIKRFCWRNPQPNRHVKSIINLKKVRSMNPHTPNHQWCDTHKNYHNTLCKSKKAFDDIAQLNHYYIKTKEEWVQKYSRGSANKTKNEKMLDRFWGGDHSSFTKKDLSAYNFLYPKDNKNKNFILGLKTDPKNIFFDLENKICAEIGVQTGKWAEKIYQCNPKRLFLIDCWEQQSTIIYSDMCNVDNTEQNKKYKIVKNRFKNFKNVTIIKAFSEHAVLKFPDNYFDFVYIDANHSYVTCLNDIQMWYPKIKVGGLISGHDYRYKDHPGVQKAVKEFVKKNKLHLYELTRDSWGIIKPLDQN